MSDFLQYILPVLKETFYSDKAAPTDNGCNIFDNTLSLQILRSKIDKTFGSDPSALVFTAYLHVLFLQHDPATFFGKRGGDAAVGHSGVSLMDAVKKHDTITSLFDQVVKVYYMQGPILTSVLLNITPATFGSKVCVQSAIRELRPMHFRILHDFIAITLGNETLQNLLEYVEVEEVAIAVAEDVIADEVAVIEPLLVQELDVQQPGEVVDVKPLLKWGDYEPDSCDWRVVPAPVVVKKCIFKLPTIKTVPIMRHSRRLCGVLSSVEKRMVKIDSGDKITYIQFREDQICNLADKKIMNVGTPVSFDLYHTKGKKVLVVGNVCVISEEKLALMRSALEWWDSIPIGLDHVVHSGVVQTGSKKYQSRNSAGWVEVTKGPGAGLDLEFHLGEVNDENNTHVEFQICLTSDKNRAYAQNLRIVDANIPVTPGGPLLIQDVVMPSHLAFPDIESAKSGRDDVERYGVFKNWSADGEIGVIHVHGVSEIVSFHFTRILCNIDDIRNGSCVKFHLFKNCKKSGSIWFGTDVDMDTVDKKKRAPKISSMKQFPSLVSSSVGKKSSRPSPYDVLDEEGNSSLEGQ